MFQQLAQRAARVFLLLCTLAVITSAQVQPNVQINPDLGITPIVGAPTVTIVTAAKKDNANKVEVKWTANIPTLTDVTGFDVRVEVQLKSGKLLEGHQNNLAGNTREALITVLGSETDVQSKKTTIITTFRTPSTATHNATFTLGQPAPAPPRPTGRVVEVTSVTKQPSCLAGAGKDCFEVRWTTRSTAPSVAGITGFSLKLDVSYANGQTVNGTATASASQNQAVITLTRPANVAATTAAVAMTAGITFVGQVVTVK